MLWTPLNTKAVEGWDDPCRSKEQLLIHSTFPDLPFFGELVRLSECPMTSIATEKLPETWNAGDLYLVLCCKANEIFN